MLTSGTVHIGEDGPVRLFCVHHAGGTQTVFRDWASRLGPAVEVEPVRLPGRERRAPLPATMDDLVHDLHRELAPRLRPPYAFYGHSMGGLIAYRLTLAVQAAGDTPPQSLLIGGCQAPGRSNDLVATARHKPEPELAADLIDLGGMSPTLRDYPDWRRAAVDLVREDLRVCATGTPPAGRVDCPVHVFTGADDPLVSLADARAWHAFTRDTCAVHRLPGGHLFLLGDTAPALLGRIATALSETASRQRTGSHT